MEHRCQSCQNNWIRPLEPNEDFVFKMLDIRYYIDETIYNSFSLYNVGTETDPLAHYAICFYLKYKYVA